MIKLNDKFEAEHDGKQWVLHETYEGEDKKGNPKEQRRQSYHGTLRQACKKVIESSVTDCSDAKSIMAALNKAGWVLEGQASGYWL